KCNEVHTSETCIDSIQIYDPTSITSTQYTMTQTDCPQQLMYPVNTLISFLPTFDKMVQRAHIRTKEVGRIYALFDTGASVDAISSRIWNAYPEFQKFEKKKFTIFTAGGEVQISNYIMLTLLDTDREIPVKFYHIKNSPVDFVISNNTAAKLGYELRRNPNYKHDGQDDTLIIDNKDTWDKIN